jgi:hypothetical protein
MARAEHDVELEVIDGRGVDIEPDAGVHAGTWSVVTAGGRFLSSRSQRRR